MMISTELRNKVNKMTKEEMISLRPLMQILSLGCINKFNTTIVNL